jgi:glycosyltransferase involved in cell wall biosynthesis
MQNKILEALCMEIPVITTDIAAEAFESNIKSTLITASAPQDLADMIIQHYYPNSPAHSVLREAVVTKHNWKTIIQNLIPILYDPT